MATDGEGILEAKRAKKKLENGRWYVTGGNLVDLPLLGSTWPQPKPVIVFTWWMRAGSLSSMLPGG